MSEHTVIGSPLVELGWTVYRVFTSSSGYHLAIHDGSVHRRCAILRGSSHAAGAVDSSDSAPLVGGASLFEVPPSEWVGHSLAVGPVKTSPVRKVERESDLAVVTSITRRSAVVPTPSPRTGFVAQPAKQSANQWAPYPEDFVERVEVAAAFLRKVYQRTGLWQDLARRPELQERFQVAVSECGLLLRALVTRMAGGR